MLPAISLPYHVSRAATTGAPLEQVNQLANDRTHAEISPDGFGLHAAKLLFSEPHANLFAIRTRVVLAFARSVSSVITTRTWFNVRHLKLLLKQETRPTAYSAALVAVKIRALSGTG